MSYISATSLNDVVYVWERNEQGERILRDYAAPYYFYYDDEDGEYRTIYDTPVAKQEFRTKRKYDDAKKRFTSEGIKLWESDFTCESRILSGHYYNVPAPKLHTTFLDIEVDYDPKRGFSTIADPYAPINSVALLHYWKNEMVVLVVPPDDGWDEQRLESAVRNAEPTAPITERYTTRFIVCADERELLAHLIYELEDSDAMCGWNSDFFDIPYIVQRITIVLDKQNVNLETVEEFNQFTNKVVVKYRDDPNVVLDTCRAVRRLDFDSKLCTPKWRPVTTQAGKLMGNTVDFVGKLRMDFMDLYKKYEVSDKPSYKLSAISDAVLVNDDTGEPLLPKLEYQGSLADLYRNDFAYFVRYNIRDCEILGGFEDKLGYVDLANQMYHLSTCLFKDVTGTLKLAENALVNYCHHTLSRVVKNTTRPDVDRSIDGALVLLPQIGMHSKFGSIDINSLYPSGIRSLNISPETIRGQFARNSRDFEAIRANSLEMITFTYELDGVEETKPACDWREFLTQQKWAVSGYGTVFDQTKQGFIPALLADWYATRKKYQALKKEAEAAGDAEKAGYYDRLQYVYKIKLNSLYGALTNLYFRFYDIRMGESTTGTGRVILKHQCRKTTEMLEGNYDVDFPLYATFKDALEAGYTEDEARDIVLEGPRFNGQFQSDCVIYGDTDSTYFKTYAQTDEEAIIVADAVAEAVNASYPQFMRDTFLCTPGYDNIIKAGREIVSDRGIFVEKKRYILHLINLDGKPVDKMKVMGLDTKKTTLPAHVAKKLNGFIERYLKGESWEDISVSIVEYKDELLGSENITDIGLPKGIKGIEEYTAKFEDDPTTRLPGHVAAAVHYNLCRKRYGDNASPEIMSGMKIKVFYLRGSHGRFKSIALPTDIEVVPDWFLVNFNVDKQAHIERLVDNPLSNILKAIGKETPSKQSLLIDELLSF